MSVPLLLLAEYLGENQQGADNDEGEGNEGNESGHCGFLSRVFIIPCVISATPVTNVTKNINAGKFGETLDPMLGSKALSEI